MEKLLHERLREAEGIGDLQYITGCESEEEFEIYTALADEIERCYIPRPRFEDGEPVVKGSETELGTVWSVSASDDGYWKLFDEEGFEFSYGEKGDFVKRPTPKVLDADGVEIEVGDTVWTSMYTDNPYTVERISTNHKGEPLVMVKEMGSGLFPATCYHERPVFDAEGVRICKGDTVYLLKGTCAGEKNVVDEVSPGFIRFDGTFAGADPSNLTHREPDSLEKLRDDMNAVIAPTDIGHKKFADRLTALIERGA